VRKIITKIILSKFVIVQKRQKLNKQIVIYFCKKQKTKEKSFAPKPLENKEIEIFNLNFAKIYTCLLKHFLKEVF